MKISPLIPALFFIILLPASVQADNAAGAILDLAELHMRAKTFASALDYYEKAAAKAAGSVHAHIGIQEASRQSGKDVFPAYEKRYQENTKDAMAAFLYARLLRAEAALKVLDGVARADFFVHLGRARALQKLGKSDAAGAIATAESRCPEDPRAYGLLASYYEQAGKHRLALAAYEKALEIAPGRIDSMVGAGNNLRLLERLDEAIAVLRKALKADENDPAVLYVVGLTYLDRGEPDIAIRHWESVLKRLPDDVDTLLSIGDAYLDKDMPDKAEKGLRRAVELAPRRVRALRRLGYALELQDKNDEALKQYQEIAKLSPLDAHCHTAIGWILVKKGKFDPALRELKQAADLAPKDVTPIFFMGYAYDLLGRWGEAADAYKKAIKINPDYAPAHNNLGLDHDLLGKTKKALASFKKALDLDPESVDYALNLGNAYYHAKKYKEAVSVFADLVDDAPDILEAWTGLARGQNALRRFKEAAEAYEGALKIAPEEADLHLVVGIIYQMNLKENAKALDHYEQYLKLGGSDPLVQGWVDNLKKKVR